jgi:hypothetical protein
VSTRGWAVIGVVTGEAADEVLCERRDRIRAWARGETADPRAMLGGTLNVRKRIVQAAITRRELLTEDRWLALAWLRAQGRAQPRPGEGVLAKIEKSPVPEATHAADHAMGNVPPGCCAEVPAQVPMADVYALAREWDFQDPALEAPREDVPWTSIPAWDTQGMLAVTLHGFLPDPALVGESWEGDWRGWLWAENVAMGSGYRPAWVEDVSAGSRLYAMTEMGDLSLPIRADVDRIRAYPPRIGTTVWLIRRDRDSTWWICWPVDPGDRRTKALRPERPKLTRAR